MTEQWRTLIVSRSAKLKPQTRAYARGDCQVIVRAAKDYANDVREGLFPKSALSNQQISDLAGRRVIPSLNDPAFEELKDAGVPVR
jgi:ABC-type amino acid transport substrate-binding protein